MERINVANNGVLRLPPGFRFHPTDEELVVQYLKRKVMDVPLPASVIPEFDVCKADPWDLPGERSQERYFFSTKEAKYPNGNRSNRSTMSGYWKATGKDKAVVTVPRSINQQIIVGMKKTLVFYRGKPPHGTRTDWIMHEYRLVKPQLLNCPCNKNFVENTGEARGNWVLCRIFLKKRSNSSTNQEQEQEEEQEEEEGIICYQENNNNINTRLETPIFYDFMSRDRRSFIGANLNLPACSSSSDVTMEIDGKDVVNYDPAHHKSWEEQGESSSSSSSSSSSNSNSNRP